MVIASVVRLVVSLLALVVGPVVSLLVLVVSLLPSFFFYFNLFMCFSLPLLDASTHFGSFVTFSDVLSLFILRFKEKRVETSAQ